MCLIHEEQHIVGNLRQFLLHRFRSKCRIRTENRQIGTDAEPEVKDAIPDALLVISLLRAAVGNDRLTAKRPHITRPLLDEMLERTDDDDRELFPMLRESCGRAEARVRLSRARRHVEDAAAIRCEPPLDGLLLVIIERDILRLRQPPARYGRENVLWPLLWCHIVVKIKCFRLIPPKDFPSDLRKGTDIKTRFLIVPDGIKCRCLCLHARSILCVPRTEHVEGLVIFRQPRDGLIHRTGKCNDIPGLVLDETELLMIHASPRKIFRRRNPNVEKTACDEIRQKIPAVTPLGGVRFKIIELTQECRLDDLRSCLVPTFDSLAVFFREVRRRDDFHPPAPPHKPADARQNGKERRRGKEPDRSAVAAGPRKQRHIKIAWDIIAERAVLGPNGYVGQTHVPGTFL